MSTFTREKLANILEGEGEKKLTWKPGSEAEKFKKKFWDVFGKGKWSWCAATVTWGCEEAGLPMPIKCPSKFGYTFALVEAWQQWAIEKGFYHDNDGKFVPERGDIVCFDWDQRDIHEKDTDWENHIGVFLRMDSSGNFICAEGNTSNATGIKKRTSKQIQGYIRIPDGYSFPLAGGGVPTVPVAQKSDTVKALQKALNDLGAKIKVDGLPGPATQAAMLLVAKGFSK